MTTDAPWTPRAVREVGVYQLNMPRGEPWVTGEVFFELAGPDGGENGPEIKVSISVPWDRDADTVEGVRRRLAARARSALGDAAALSDEALQDLLERSIQERPPTDWGKVLASDQSS